VNALASLISALKDVCAGLPDRRKGQRCDGEYSMADIGLFHEYDGRNGTERQDQSDSQAVGRLFKTYLEPETEHTVRRLAADLNISKPAITRALDRLTDSDFIRREKDANDRRSVIVSRTSAGSTYLRTLSGYVNDADKLAAKQTAKAA
jgi:hypothetical protein